MFCEKQKSLAATGIQFPDPPVKNLVAKPTKSLWFIKHCL